MSQVDQCITDLSTQNDEMMDRLYKLEAAVAATATAAAGVGGSSSSGSVAGVGAGAVGAGVVVPLQEKVVTLTRANEELTVHAAKLTERLVLGEQKVPTHLLLNQIYLPFIYHSRLSFLSYS